MSLKHTPLYAEHLALQAQMVPFGGWEMPVRYSGDIIEHQAVRLKAGLFDVSHMGEVSLRGPKALEVADFLLTNHISALRNGQAAYAGMLNEKGGFVDDVVAYRFSDEHVFICINAGNRDKDAEWIKTQVEQKYTSEEVTVRNESDEWGQVAIQGPMAAQIVSEIYGPAIHDIKRYHFMTQQNVVIARTGYTGEDGFELFVPAAQTAHIWKQLLILGASKGLIPCGLAARDTLRLEAGMCLYGNDIDEQHTPLEAGLSWIVKLNKPVSFIGKEALVKQHESGVKRKLVGLIVTDKGIARHAYPVKTADGTWVGEVTSGTMAPYLQKAIAMAYVDSNHAKAGDTLYIEVRNRLLAALVVPLPFYKRSKENK